MPHIPLLDADTATPAQAEVLKLLPPINLFRTMAHAPMMTRRFAELGAEILFNAQLDGKIRELVILRISHLMSCTYERVQHERIARDLGIDEDRIKATTADEISPLFDAKTRIAMQYADEMYLETRPPAATITALRGAFSDEEVAELTLSIAYYIAAAHFMEALGIELEGAGFDGGVKINNRPTALEQ